MAVVALVVLTSIAAWAKAPPSWVQAHNQRNAGKDRPREDESMKPASHVRRLGTSIELRVGEKRSFREVHMAGVTDPSVARIKVDEGVLTIRGLKTGATNLQIFPPGVPSAETLSKPRELRVTVK